MLDATTKRRIDTARDLLVGKVPDPKSQVEQITIALIYKFMDDIDAESEELGGTRTFFADDFARFGWARLMHAGLGGHEMLNRYAEAITRMPENPGIPPLFRDIFKNAFLPYRDPETLRDFLKVIDEFTYDHSERLGDAFEYLLSVLGSQGDAGQFRTPRHIIDFIVAVLDPKKDETILDPACGTAGFLISSYKHILRHNSSEPSPQPSPSGRGGEGAALLGDLLTPDDRRKLATNFQGYDISPDMVRLSLVNLYLHGFADPHIFEYDTLTSQERWNAYADVILANPPFMSPKGGIRPHTRFSVQSKRSEVLFVDYIAEHLTPNGRAGIIVPEGIIFQSQTAYKHLRKLLVEDYLVAVVSLPAGVFQPYSGVKTSILLLDKTLAKQTDRIAFFKVEHDGFDLGAQRRAIEKNDLPQVQKELGEYLGRLRAGEVGGDFQPTLTDRVAESGVEYTKSRPTHGLVAEKEKIAEGGEYNLSGERYRTERSSQSNWSLVRVGDVFRKSEETVLPELLHDSVAYISLQNIERDSGQLSGDVMTDNPSEIKSLKNIFSAGDILYGKLRPNLNKVWLADRKGICSTDIFVVRPVDDRALPAFYAYVFLSRHFNESVLRQIKGAQLPRVGWRSFANIEIPLPPLEVQREFVEEIEGYQKVVDGARAVVENYRPQVDIDPEWPLIAIGELCMVERGASPRPIRAFTTDSSDGVNWIKIGDATIGSKYITATKERITTAGAAKSRRVKPGDFILSNSMSFGRPYIVDIDGCIHDGWLLLRLTSDRIDQDFLYHILGSKLVAVQFERAATGGVVNNLNSKIVRAVKIPVPPIDVQKNIATEIEAEQALVAANRELIERFERKIRGVVGRVWGEGSS